MRSYSLCELSPPRGTLTITRCFARDFRPTAERPQRACSARMFHCETLYKLYPMRSVSFFAVAQSWCKIAQTLPGRTDHAIKNRFYSATRRHRPRTLKARKDDSGVPKDKTVLATRLPAPSTPAPMLLTDKSVVPSGRGQLRAACEQAQVGALQWSNGCCCGAGAGFEDSAAMQPAYQGGANTGGWQKLEPLLQQDGWQEFGRGGWQTAGPQQYGPALAAGGMSCVGDFCVEGVPMAMPNMPRQARFLTAADDALQLSSSCCTPYQVGTLQWSNGYNCGAGTGFEDSAALQLAQQEDAYTGGWQEADPLQLGALQDVGLQCAGEPAFSGQFYALDVQQFGAAYAAEQPMQCDGGYFIAQPMSLDYQMQQQQQYFQMQQRPMHQPQRLMPPLQQPGQLKRQRMALLQPSVQHGPAQGQRLLQQRQLAQQQQSDHSSHTKGCATGFAETMSMSVARTIATPIRGARCDSRTDTAS